MKDLRTIEVLPKEGYATLVAGVLTMVVGGAMLLAGVFASAKIGAAIPTTDMTTAENETFQEIKGNIFDALEVGGVAIIMIGVVLLIQGVRSLGA